MKKNSRSSESLSPDPQQHRQRSREKNNKPHYNLGPDILLTKHLYFLKKAQKNLGIPLAVWNFCTKLTKRPAKILLICESENQINRILDSCKLNRPRVVVNDFNQEMLNDIIEQSRSQIVLLTDKKASMICAKDQAPKIFNLILNVAFHKDPDHYRKIHHFFVPLGGILVSFIDELREFRKIQKSTGINLKEISADITDLELNNQLLGDIQFLPKPSQDTLELIRLLPFSELEAAGRLFQLFKTNLQANKSKYLKLDGYFTLMIRTDVQFSSYKYIWNFLNDLPQKCVHDVKGMTRFKDGKGVMFDLPEQHKSHVDHFIRRNRKEIQKYNDKRFIINYVTDISKVPEYEDLESEEFQRVESMREKALRHKEEFEVFVGGLAFNTEESDIRAYFAKNGINALTIRMSKDRHGNSKGICFMLCEDDSHVRRALALDGSEFRERPLKISLAQQKKDF